MRLSRLKINRFRNVRPRTELVFGEGYNVVLGRNGSGKTTLLDLISMITCGNFAPIKGEAISLEYTLGFSDLSIDVSFENKLSSRQMSEQSFHLPPENVWALVVRFTTKEGASRLEAHPEGAILYQKSKETAQRRLSLFQNSNLYLELATLPDLVHLSPDLVVGGALLNQSYKRFDESLGAFETITEKVTLSALPHAQGQLALAGNITSFAPIELAHISLPNTQTSLSIPDQRLKFLRLVSALMEFSSATFSAELSKADKTRTYYTPVSFTFKRENGTAIHHRWLSYGQKRLLSFYYYAASNPFIIIADELVNGLHHDWIEACLELIKDRQSFLTSQNPLLMDYLSFENAEQAQKTFVLCDLDQESGEMSWRNMSDDESESFFSAYSAGIQHVGEILRTKGLW